VQGVPIIAFLAIALVMLLPLFAERWSHQSAIAGDLRAVFSTNIGRNGYIATFAGAVAGNVGIGSFLALYLFTQQSPILGFSIVGAYTLGLFFCALLSGRIHAAGAKVGAVGLVDLIAITHGFTRRRYIWLPVAIVFVLRSAVQLGALGFLTATFFGGHIALAIVGGALLIGFYLIVGGYRAAVQTDIMQAFVLVSGGIACVIGLPNLDAEPSFFFEFGAYKPVLLVGIWLFLPFSAVLAIDNWQRITLSKTPDAAKKSYLGATVVCGGLFTLMALAGYWSASEASMYETFLQLVPSGWEWIVAAMFVACIMSSIDTFIMPLVSAVREKPSLKTMRLTIAALISATALVAIFFSDTLETIIAAFNSLTVFLPAAFGALFFKSPSAKAAIWSVNGGLLVAVAMTFVDQNAASLVGFLTAAVLYAAIVRLSPNAAR